jgi:Got1/Sft2-like family
VRAGERAAPPRQRPRAPHAAPDRRDHTIMINFSDPRTIGVGLSGLGVLLAFAGILLFLDKGLISLGNIFFLAGITLTIGVPSTVKFFTRRRQRIGSACYLGGTALIVLGWTLIGLLVQGYGFWRLFAAFIPTVLQYARQVPYLSKVLDLPVVKNVINRIAPASGAVLPY